MKPKVKRKKGGGDDIRPGTRGGHTAGKNGKKPKVKK
jgi:hypothetical protein